MALSPGSMQIVKRRMACERWKVKNYEYYLEQKRMLSSRPEYKAHRREMYKIKRESMMADEDYVAPTRGRPRIYNDQDKLLRKRECARNWAMRSRVRNIIYTKENNQHESEDSTECENIA